MRSSRDYCEASLGSGRVLNAFRRQCGHHGNRARKFSSTSSCSTPFGVNAVITIRRQVRNVAATECSTPFGVNAVITKQAKARCVDLIRCSTPFGVNAVITASSLRIRPSRFVLNAFRRQCGHHSVNRANAGTWRMSSCSTPFGVNAVITRNGESRRGRWFPVLNAFRRQCGHHSGIRQ